MKWQNANRNTQIKNRLRNFLRFELRPEILRDFAFEKFWFIRFIAEINTTLDGVDSTAMRLVGGFARLGRH